MSNVTFNQKLKTFPQLPRILSIQLLFKLGLAKRVLARRIPSLTKQMASSTAFAHYLPTEHDIFAATYIKSGTNWSMQITQQIAYLGNAEFEHIHHLVAWPDASMWPTVGTQILAPLNDVTVQEIAPTSLRVIKTHLPAHKIPYSEKATYLSIIRDPKEVCVSAYYFVGSIMNFIDLLSPDDWFELNMMPGSILSGWADHTASYWAWRDRPNVLVLTFNEMKQNLPKAIERIVALMGVSLTEAQFAQVVERSSFQYMKKMDTKFAPAHSPFTGKKPITMMRKGKSGSSNELLSQTQQAAIDQFCQAELARLHSDFPYNTFF